jgi:hypothetical protein
MVLFSDRGPRSVPDEDVIFVYRDRAMGRYCSATLVLSSGEEVSGLGSSLRSTGCPNAWTPSTCRLRRHER